MKNQGLFSTLFINDVTADIELDDAAQGEMATLAQLWRDRNGSSRETLWTSFLQRALSSLQFVAQGKPGPSGSCSLFEDFSYADCIGNIQVVEPAGNIDDVRVGHYAPGKLIAAMKSRSVNWGILTDGKIWRLYSLKSSRAYEDYVELDLGAALEAQDEDGYGLFARFFHRDSFVPEKAADDESTDDTGKEAERKIGVYKCRLDRDKEQSEEVLEAKVKAPLLAQVDEVLQYICNGLIADTPKKGNEYTEEERAEIFQSAVKLLYRCLFLFYAESRHLLPADASKNESYRRHSMQALCQAAHKFHWGQRKDQTGYDLWAHLKELIRAINEGDPEYGTIVEGYNGGLFDDAQEVFLGKHRLRNDFLARALYLLAFVEPLSGEEEDEYAIPYADLEVRHMGELYENILEFNVQLCDADRIRRRGKKGEVQILLASENTRKPGDAVIKKGEVYFGESALERKQTGSYYTPESLVRFLNGKAIIAPLQEKFTAEHRARFDAFLKQIAAGQDLAARRGAGRSAIALIERFVADTVLKFKVCDPAMGSGHFLVDVSNQMTALVVEWLSEIPAADGLQTEITCRPNDWRRKITRFCIYGVDMNPLAVHLARLSLWLNSFAGEHKLTFLDHHMRCGNSLIGLRQFVALNTIPERRKDTSRDRDEADHTQLRFDKKAFNSQLHDAAQVIGAIENLSEDDTNRQRDAFQKASRELQCALSPLADLHTAYLMEGTICPGDYGRLLSHFAKSGTEETLPDDLHVTWQRVGNLRARHHFFHWPLEFPDIFDASDGQGFSAIVGNPPWETWNPQTIEFFSQYFPEFSSLSNQEAKSKQEELCKLPEIAAAWAHYQAGFYESSFFFQNDQCYANQDIQPPGSNLYKLFLERSFRLLRETGSAGMIVPDGFYSSSATKALRQFFLRECQIDSLYCFENRYPTVFNGVDGRQKFITITFEKKAGGKAFRCAFMQHDPSRLAAIEAAAIWMKPEHVARFSPDSFSITEFNAQRDVDIAEKLYSKYSLLGETVDGSWNFPLLSVEFNMTHQSAMFRYSGDGYRLYEGKMMNQFDHLFSNGKIVIEKIEAKNYLLSKELFRMGRASALATLVQNEKIEPRLPLSRYRFGVRSIASSTNERALITTVLPQNICVGNSLFTAIPWTSRDSNPRPEVQESWYHDHFNGNQLLFVVAVLNSFPYDWLTRMKISTNLNVFILNQLPMPRLGKGGANDIKYFWPIVARALRLICTTEEYSELWTEVFPRLPAGAFVQPFTDYGPAHERQVRESLTASAKSLTKNWTKACGLHDRLSDRRDTGDRAQTRAELDALVAHFFSLTRSELSYVLDTFPGVRNKEIKAFGEFQSHRKCLEEYDRLAETL